MGVRVAPSRKGLARVSFHPPPIRWPAMSGFHPTYGREPARAATSGFHPTYDAGSDNVSQSIARPYAATVRIAPPFPAQLRQSKIGQR